MEFVREYLLEGEELTPSPLGAKIQQWATQLPDLEGSTTTLGMRRSFIDDMLYCVNDDVYDLIGRDVEGYEEGKIRIRKTESRDFFRKRREREDLRLMRKEKAATAPPTAPLIDGLTPSEHFRREQRLQAEAAAAAALRSLRCGRPRCPCAEDPCICPCPPEVPCFIDSSADDESGRQKN